MTEFEINKKVAEKLSIPYYVVNEVVFNVIDETIFDPCNNGSQAWEIMLKFDISITSNEDGFIAMMCVGSNYDKWDNNTLYCEYSKHHSKPSVAMLLLLLEVV